MKSSRNKSKAQLKLQGRASKDHSRRSLDQERFKKGPVGSSFANDMDDVEATDSLTMSPVGEEPLELGTRAERKSDSMLGKRPAARKVRSQEAQILAKA